MAETASTLLQGWVRAILRCPACRSPLDDAAGPGGAAELWCDGSLDPSCRRQYRFDDAIPVLLVEEARHPGGSTTTPSGALPGGATAIGRDERRAP